MYFLRGLFLTIELLHFIYRDLSSGVRWPVDNKDLMRLLSTVSDGHESIQFFLVYVKQAQSGCRVNLPLISKRRIRFSDHILHHHLRAPATTEQTPPWIMWQCERPLTLQLSGAQAFLKPLHLILQEADMPHHVLWWVYLHGNISWGGRGWHWLVQLLLKDSGLEKYIRHIL